MVKPELVELPAHFNRYRAGRGPTDGSLNIDLGMWRTGDGVERFHMNIDVASMPTLIDAIKGSKGDSKTLYRCIKVFRVAGIWNYTTKNIERPV